MRICMNKPDILIVSLVFLSLLMNIIVLPFMPDIIDTHWSANGVPDDSMTKGIGLFMLTFFLAMMAVIVIVIPKIKQIKEFLKRYMAVYYAFGIWFMSMLFFVNVYIVLWNLDIIHCNPRFVTLISLAVLAIGLVCALCTKETEG